MNDSSVRRTRRDDARIALELSVLEPRLLLSGDAAALGILSASPVSDVPEPEFVWRSGDCVVSVYDLAGEVDIHPWDIQVKFGKDGASISSIILGGYQPMDGLAIIISGATTVGSIKDARKGALGDVMFIACDAPVGSISLKSDLTGYLLNGESAGGIDFAADIDGDGDTDDLTAFVGVGSPVGKLAVGRSVAGDVVIEGADAKGYATRQFKTGGDFHGEFMTDADVGQVSIGGSFGSLIDVVGDVGSVQIKGDFGAESEVSILGNLGTLTVGGDMGPDAEVTVLGNLRSFAVKGTYEIGSDVFVLGTLGKLSLADYETENGGDLFGIQASSFGSLKLGFVKLTESYLPFPDGDFLITFVV